ncbi:MAG: LysR family transcriptional regulator [Lautropia sp.]
MTSLNRRGGDPAVPAGSAAPASPAVSGPGDTLSHRHAAVSIRQLRAFVALAEHRRFTRAADELHLSQSAFSAAIRALERLVGVRLFERDTRNVELTAEGALFRERAARLLGDFQAALLDLDDHAARRRGRVALAALPSLAAGWLPGVLARFRGRYPGIEIDVADVLSDGCVERVRTGRADFALAAVRAEAAALRAEPFCSDRFHLVCRRDHRLARRRRPSLADLAGEPFVHLARHSSVRQHVEAAVRPAQLNRVMELDQLSTVASMVRAGLGITVVPTLTLFHFRHPELACRPLADTTLRRQLFVIRRRDRGLTTAAQALYDALMAQRPRTDSD